ncbi:hypothetical protein GQ54DRAFT_304637 [Martensiomyces pterosporus]|nr:hypothetical protein GQ54DRAFT_304637 [Martensiomyces pterosporus]
MRFPVFLLVVIALFSVLLPVPKRYLDHGSFVHDALDVLPIPSYLLVAALHPASVSPVLYLLLLRALHIVLSFPVRVFFARFGLDVRGFSGTSFSGLFLSVRVRNSMEFIIRVEEVGFDIRTMRRLRKRGSAMLQRLRNRFRSWRAGKSSAGAHVQVSTVKGPEIDDQAGLSSATNGPEKVRQNPASDTNTSSNKAEKDCSSSNSSSSSSSSSSGSGSGGLSKRLQIYARGVHIQLLAAPSQPSDHASGSNFWFDKSSDEDIAGRSTSTQSAAPQDQAADRHVLDRETRQMAAKLARKLSTILRTYAYFASLFARWIDISMFDVSLMVVHSSDMARAGHGVTLHVSNVMVWAESARESNNGGGPGWIPTDIVNSLHGIVEWLLRVLKFSRTGSDEDEVRHAQEQAAAQHTPAPGSGSPESSKPSARTIPELVPPASAVQRRDRSRKYLSTLAVEISDIRLFPGIEGAQQHLNSRWELVKMLVMQDMLPSKNPHDNDKPHRRGPALTCRKCTIKNDVITSFWGLPKKVDQSIEFDQAHIRAGIVEPLLDEIAIMCLAPSAHSSEASIHGLGSLDNQLASILRQYGGEVPPGVAHHASGTTDAPARDSPSASATDGASSQDKTSEHEGASAAQEQVNRMLFRLHEILSKLRLEHVCIAIRANELVFDLPLTRDSKKEPLAIAAPGMLRWRQKNVAIEGGYLWNSISSGSGSVVNTAMLGADARGDTAEGEGDVAHHPWPADEPDVFGADFGDGRDAHRPKDSTAFVRVSSGKVQVTALRTPSMTADPRAEELHPDSPGFKLKYCTLYGEMSAFLSEDLTCRPCPKPAFSLDVGHPELTLDLHTQLAIDEATLWAGHVARRFKEMKSIAQRGRTRNRTRSTTDQGSMSENAAPNHRLYAFVNLVFADVKLHIAVERALYAVRPFVVPSAAESKRDEDKFIALRMRHMECHMLWSLADAESRQPAGDDSGDDGSSSSSDDSGSFYSVASSTDSPGAERDNSPAELEPSRLNFLAPKIQFKLSTSPVTAGWESLQKQEKQQPARKASGQPSSSGRTHSAPRKMLLCAKHGIRASGSADLVAGPASACADRPRINANVVAEIGEVAGMLREYDFKKWLSMQPLWLATRIMRISNLGYQGTKSSSANANSAYLLASVEERRKALTATVHVLFESIRATILACDNEEDVRSGIEHGTQICLYRGFVDIRANGGSLESPHPFGFRPDAGKITLNIECSRASMFLLSAVPKHSARTSNGSSSSSSNNKTADALPADFVESDLCGDLPDTVQPHIVLVRPRFNFSRQKLEPYRARMIIDLTTTALNGVTCVSSVYRWSVFMHHIKYWSRRKKLARRMATQFEEPSPPDDLLVYINSDMLDLHGDLVSPRFFDLDKGLVKSLQIGVDSKNPQMKLKMPDVRFTIEKTKAGTDSDLAMSIGGPIATLYGSSTPKGQAKRTSLQPLISLKGCTMSFRFPRKDKREKLGSEQGVRRNSTYEKIDIMFEKGAIAFGHRYNMAETIDGYILLQKGCKRIARKSTSTCYPPLAFPESALSQKPTPKMILSTLGNPHTYSPPPLRSMTGVKPPPPPTLAVPDDIPTIDFHGPELSILIHDDPFETALARIYQVGLREQRERLSRLEAFNTKAQEIRSKREQDFLRHNSGTSNERRQPSPASSRARLKKAGHTRRKRVSKDTKSMREASTFTGGRPTSGSSTRRRPGLANPRTFSSIYGAGNAASFSSFGAGGNNLQSIASASVQDVSSFGGQVRHRTRNRTNSAAAGDAARSYASLASDSGAGGYADSVNSACSSNDNDNDNDNDDDGSYYDDIESQTPHPDPYQRMVSEVSAEIDAAYQRLMAVESREWVKAIRQRMVPPAVECAGAASGDGEMRFEDIFDVPPETSDSHREQECGSPHASIPYNYVSASWTHPSVPLGRLVMSPVWISINTPLSLLEFGQIEDYLRYLDTTTPHSLKWSTLVPTRVRIKCGDIRMQLRDFPFPLFRVPDPYRADTSRTAPHMGASYEDFCGGVEVSGSLIVAERTAHERSLRSVYIPIGPRSKDSGVDLPDVGWYVAKSLQFPRIFTTLSILMFAAPPEDSKGVRMFQHRYIQSRLPPLPIMSTWGASYQPAVSALMQRFESFTSKSADVSPALPWWDKLRSRMHFKCRMAVINAPLRDESLPKRPQAPAALDEDTAELYTRKNLSTPNIHRHTDGKDKEQGVSAGEEGQMFFLALDGRDPYQVTQKTGGYLFAMRGGVRICLNEGLPGKELWDEHSGRGIYSVPSEESAPPPATLDEFLRLRCEEFLMGVPIIIDRQSAILKSMNLIQGIRDGAINEPGVGSDPTSTVDVDAVASAGASASGGLGEIEIGDILPRLGCKGSLGRSPSEPISADETPPLMNGSREGPQSWRKAHIDLLYNISHDSSARYTFVTNSVDKLYHKVLLHLSGGVRLGIGLSSYIPPDRSGQRHNHWEVQPIAPESAAAAAMRGTSDAYVGYRTTKLHTGVSLRCPFTEAGSPAQPSFSTLYLSTRECALDGSSHGRQAKAGLRKGKAAPSMDAFRGIGAVPRLRSPGTSVLSKPPRQWNAHDIDALVSPLHCRFSSAEYAKIHGGSRGERGSHHGLSTLDLFFTPFPLSKDELSTGEAPAAFAADGRPRPHHTVKRASAKPQCQISASSATIDGIQQYLPLYVSRMMLPVRKGTLYPFTETSGNKLGKCVRSMRLLLDLKNVELSYSQRDFEIKELETREVTELGYGDIEVNAQRAQSPAPSDFNSLPNQTISGAKAEGTVRELKARVDSFSFNLLLEQTSVKLHVGRQSTPEPGSPAPSAPASVSSSMPSTGGNSSTHGHSAAKARPRGGESKRQPKKQAAETQALRWGVGDASTEIDYLDVRLIQMSFIMPLFMNSLSTDYVDQSKRHNGLKFTDGSFRGLTVFERSWISPASIRDLNELDLGEALFSSPSVVSVLWSPRMVYFTQRPEWSQFSDTVDGILDSTSAAGGGSPRASPDAAAAAAAANSSSTTPTARSDATARDSLKVLTQGGVVSLDSSLASMPEPSEADDLSLRRSLSASRARASSDAKRIGRAVRQLSSASAKICDDGSSSAVHRRNTSMPWGLSRHMSHEGSVAETLFVKPNIPHIYSPNAMQPTVFAQRAFTQLSVDSSSSAAELPGSAAHGSSSTSHVPDMPQLAEPGAEAKSPTSTMSYKSSFHLLELARSRQRRLTASNSRQTLNALMPSQQAQESAVQSAVALDTHQQTSVCIDQTTSNNQITRMVPTGPDPNVIMRDSRSTQAILLKKRKEMLGIAIQHEQASLAYLSHEFERAPNKHNEEFRKGMVRRAEHIYELGARRKLINRCLRVLGVDPDAEDNRCHSGIPELPEGGTDFDRDTQEVEKVLASLYRHRCLIYSGYLIWTTQVRDILTRFLYIQDCLSAIEYYMSETATKVARNATSDKEAAGSDGATDLSEHAAESHAQCDKLAAKPVDEYFSLPIRETPGTTISRPKPKASGRRSSASGSSPRTRHFPKLLRRLRSHDKLGSEPQGSKGAAKRQADKGFSWRSDRSKPKKKGRVRRKEEYKPSAHRVTNNKFEKGLKSVWDDFSRYHPYYSFLVEFLNSQVSMRVDEKTSTTSVIAVAERVQLHRILLCNEDDFVASNASNEQAQGTGQVSPPDDEAIVKTRSLVEVENVQIFTAKRDDFENQAAYFVDCTYGSQFEGDASQPGTIWPAWIPIELLLSQGKHKARGIFEESELDGASDSNDVYPDSDDSSSSGFTFASDEQSQRARGSRGRRSRYGRAWWLQDLSKYKRLMDRNNGLLVYDKANPHRIQGDSAENLGFSVPEDEEGGGCGESSTAGAPVAAEPASAAASGSSAARESSAAEAAAGDGNKKGGSRTSDERSTEASPGRASADKRNLADSASDDAASDDSIDEAEATGSHQGLSHRANHFSVFLPELDLACTAEQYVTVYETVTDLLVYIDAEKAAYMDHLNTILLSIDMEDLRGLLKIIRATQDALRERLPIIQDWYAVQRSNVVMFRDVTRAVPLSDHRSLYELDFSRQQSRAVSLLTLDRHRRALELQLRTAMDLFGAAQKQKKQQRRLESKAARAAPGKGAGSHTSHRRPSNVSAASESAFSQGADRKTLASRHTNVSSLASEAISDRPSVRSRQDIAAQSAAASSRLSSTQTTEETQSTIARTIHLFISKATWHMLENDGQPLCDVTLRWASLKAVTTSDQATQLLSEVHLLYIVNRLPNPMFTDLVGPYVRPKHPRPDFCIDKMIRVRWSELAPVGGISIVERFEVNLFPLRLQLSHDIAQKLINYLYPYQESSQGFNAGASLAAGKADLPSSGTPGRHRRPTVSSMNSDAGRDAVSTHLSPTPAPLNDNGPLPPAAPPRSKTTASVNSSAGGGHSALQPAAKPHSGGGSKSLFATKMRKTIDDHAKGNSAASTPDAEGTALTAPSPSPAASGVFMSMSSRNSPLSLFSENTSVISMSQSGENRDQIDQMKQRASSNKTFLNIKIGGSSICISYQGKKASNITDLRDFEFHAPTLELRNQVESYYELLMQVKKEYMAVVVHHTGALVKEKFRQLHNRKAWSKSSFGPDWEARNLLIDMDRRVEMGMMASIQGSTDGREQFPSSTPRQMHGSHVPGAAGAGDAEGAVLGDAIRVPAEIRSLASSPPSSSASMMSTQRGGDQPTDGEDTASQQPAAGKAPLAKYMILDPRKLMGKRLPSMLPKNFSRIDSSRSDILSLGKGHGDEDKGSEDRGRHRARGDQRQHPADVTSTSVPFVAPPPGLMGFRPLYSSMYVDMLPAATGVRSESPARSPSSPRRTKGSPPPPPPLPLPRNGASGSASPARSPLLPPQLVPMAPPSSGYKSDGDGSDDRNAGSNGPLPAAHHIHKL